MLKLTVVLDQDDIHRLEHYRASNGYALSYEETVLELVRRQLDEYELDTAEFESF